MNSRRVLMVACGALAISAILPARFFSWFDGFGWAKGVVDAMTAPIQAPLHWSLQTLRGSNSGLSDGEQQHLRQEAREGATWKLQYEKAQVTIEQLQRQISQIQGMMILNPGFVAKQVTLPVTGVQRDGASAMLRFRGDTVARTSVPGDGDDRSAIAVTDGVFLVGRVMKWASISQVLPIADPVAGELRGAILTDERFADDLSTAIIAADRPREKFQVVLMPTGLGTLAGPVLNVDGRASGVSVSEGMVVRLEHRGAGAWPEHAQMLVVGRVTRVTEQGNGRKIVTVAPMYDLTRIGEITIRFLDTAESAPGTQRGGGSGGGR